MHLGKTEPIQEEQAKMISTFYMTMTKCSEKILPEVDFNIYFSETKG